jgi:hypothetical protein
MKYRFELIKHFAQYTTGKEIGTLLSCLPQGSESVKATFFQKKSFSKVLKLRRSWVWLAYGNG